MPLGLVRPNNDGEWQGDGGQVDDGAAKEDDRHDDQPGRKMHQVVRPFVLLCRSALGCEIRLCGRASPDGKQYGLWLRCSILLLLLWGDCQYHQADSTWVECCLRSGPWQRLDPPENVHEHHQEFHSTVNCRIQLERLIRSSRIFQDSKQGIPTRLLNLKCMHKGGTRKAATPS